MSNLAAILVEWFYQSVIVQGTYERQRRRS